MGDGNPNLEPGDRRNNFFFQKNISAIAFLLYWGPALGLQVHTLTNSYKGYQR